MESSCALTCPRVLARESLVYACPWAHEPIRRIIANKSGTAIMVDTNVCHLMIRLQESRSDGRKSRPLNAFTAMADRAHPPRDIERVAEPVGLSNIYISIGNELFLAVSKIMDGWPPRGRTAYRAKAYPLSPGRLIRYRAPPTRLTPHRDSCHVKSPFPRPRVAIRVTRPAIPVTPHRAPREIPGSPSSCRACSTTARQPGTGCSTSGDRDSCRRA